MASQFFGQSAGIYPRVSTTKQAREGKTSLKDQEIDCRAYADDLGMVIDESCVEPEAFTSTQMDRPGLNTLLAKMRAHGVKNLIIDTADRMTREGQLAAATFLSQFTAAGIVLHVVSLDLVVDDDRGVKDFLDAAYSAQQDNALRTRKSKRSKLSRAQNGTYNRGNRPCYGFRYVPVSFDVNGNPTDKKVEPDDVSYIERGFTTTFAPNPYEARREILRLYVDEGLALQGIANTLNAARVPTSSALLGWSGTTGTWWARTVNEIINHPINQGRLVNRFSRPEGQPAQVIDVTSKHGNPQALLDDHAVRIVARRREANRAGFYARTSIHTGRALLGGGIGRCGRCGGSLRVKGVQYKGRFYLYYSCTRHDKAPTLCRGLVVAVKDVDQWAWLDVTNSLNTITWNPDEPGSELRALEILDANRPAIPASGPTLEHLKAARAALARDAETYAVEIVRAQSQLARDTLQRHLDRLEPELRKADEQIAELERQESTQAERAHVLGDFLSKYHRYFEYLDLLSVDNEADIPVMAAILRAVGTRVTVPPTAVKRSKPVEGSAVLDLGPDLGIELTLTAGASFPWVENEDLVRMLEDRRTLKAFGTTEPGPAQKWFQWCVPDSERRQ